MILEKVKKSIKGKGIRIAFADAYAPSVLRACELLVKDGLGIPYLIGSRPKIEEVAKKNKISLQGFEVRDPDWDENTGMFGKALFEVRKHKGIIASQALLQVKQPAYFGAMLLSHGFVDGMVSGFESATKPFLPAFYCVGTKGNRASSYFIMLRNNEMYLFSDCGLIMNPSADELAEIALTTAESAKRWGMVPRVAMLSFSTRGSAKGELVDKVRNATMLAKKKNPSLVIDGEMQFDAAILPEVAKKKCPDSPLQGKANVLVFPDLNAGNIAYKMAERLGGFTALGPLLQGLNKLVNDMSRGASTDDIFNIACLTAYESLQGKKQA